MSARECPVERSVLEGLGRSGCRAGLSDSLEHHLDGCPSCRELANLVGRLRTDHAHALEERALPTASQVWWRARVRARLEAAHAVDRPIGVAHKVSMAALLGLAASLVGLQSVVDGVAALGDVTSRIVVDDVAGVVTAALQTGPIRLMLLAAAGCLAVVVPVAALVALSRD